MSTEMGRWGNQVEREQLATLEAPQSLGSRHHPTPHDRFVDTVENAFDAVGYKLDNWKFNLSSDSGKLMTTFSIESGDNRFKNDAWHLVGAAINTVNSTMSARLLFGDEVFICSNLQFNAEFMIKRKSTRDGLQDFKHMIWDKAEKIPQVYKSIVDTNNLLCQHDLSSESQVHDMMCRMAKKDITTWQSIPHVLKHWEKPEHDEFKGRNAQVLLNAFTSSWRGTNPFSLHNKSKRVRSFLVDEAQHELDIEYAVSAREDTTPEEVQDDYDHATSNWS